MNLEYIKLNDNIINLTTGVNYILGESNSGKTTLYRIIKFIYGGNEEQSNKKDFSGTKWINLLKKAPSSSITWKFSNNKKYVLNLQTKVITSGSENFDLSSYKEHILKEKDFNHYILGKSNNTINCFAWDKSPEVITESSSKYGRFFDEFGIANHTSFKYFHLLGIYEENIEEYFSVVGKKVNYEKLNKSYRDVEKQYNPELIEIIKENDNTLSRYISLKKLNKPILDQNILDDLIQISEINVEDILHFHDQLVESHNEVITLEQEKVKDEISKLSNYSKAEISNVKRIIDNSTYNKEYICDIDEQLEVLEPIKNQYENKVNLASQKMNKEILKLKKEAGISNEYKFENSIKYVKSKTKNENFVINLKGIDEEDVKKPGGAAITLNFFFFLYHVFTKSSFPIMVFEKPFFVEVKNSQEITVLNQINEKEYNKQIVIIQHPEEDFKSLDRTGNTINLEKLFGVEF